MKEHIDEPSLDVFAAQLGKKPIPVPDELEARILRRITEVQVPKRKQPLIMARKILAYTAVMLLVFTASVRWVPGFAAYASGIPVIKYAVHILQGDSGTESAKEKGYPELTPVSVEQNGYSLNIDHIMFDEDRLVMTVRAFGETIEAMLPDSGEKDKPIRAGSEPPRSPSLHLNLKFSDFEDSSWAAQYPSNDGTEKGIAIRAEKDFAEGTVLAFLAENPEFLTLSAEIMVLGPNNEQEVLQTFENIKIPLVREKISLSKRFLPDKTISVEQTKITVQQLTISPTRMRVDVSFAMPEGFFFTGFENPYLKDSNGNIYKPEGLVSRHHTETERSLYFVPSVYFDNTEGPMYFGFDGIRIGAEEGRTITISTEDSYPKFINYMGEELIIEEVTYNSSREQTLQVMMRMPKKLKIDGLNIEGAKSESKAHTDDLDDQGRPLPDMFGIEVEYRPEYTAEFSFPGYLISSPQEVEMILK